MSVSGKWGYVDNKGKGIIKPIFDEAGAFSENIARVKKDGKWGYINTLGKFIINPKYEDCWDFKNGTARAKIDGKWGFINKKGDIIIEAKYDYLWNFVDDKAKARIGSDIIYINKPTLNKKNIVDYKVSGEKAKTNKKKEMNISTRDRNSTLNGEMPAKNKTIISGVIINDVEDDSNKWKVIVNPWGVSGTNIGGFIFGKGKMVGEDAIAIFNNSDAINNNIRIDLKMATVTNTGTFNVYFRIKDLSNLYMFSLRPQENNIGRRISFWKRKNDRWLMLGRGTPFQFSRGEEYSVRVDIKGNEFTGYINGDKVETVYDNSFNKGKIGVEAFSSKALFKNIVIKSD
jgi:hypothetical protein